MYINRYELRIQLDFLADLHQRRETDVKRKEIIEQIWNTLDTIHQAMDEPQVSHNRIIMEDFSDE